VAARDRHRPAGGHDRPQGLGPPQDRDACSRAARTSAFAGGIAVETTSASASPGT